jgi:hypothetical protein
MPPGACLRPGHVGPIGRVTQQFCLASPGEVPQEPGFSPGVPSVRDTSHRERLTPRPTPPGLTGTGGLPLPWPQPGSPTEGKRRGSGREYHPRTGPVSCETVVTLPPTRPPPTGAGPPEGLRLPDPALDCQVMHGCRRGNRPQSSDCQGPIHYSFNGCGDNTASAALRHDQQGLVTRLDPVPHRTTSSYPASTRGHRGG